MYQNPLFNQNIWAHMYSNFEHYFRYLHAYQYFIVATLILLACWVIAKYCFVHEYYLPIVPDRGSENLATSKKNWYWAWGVMLISFEFYVIRFIAEEQTILNNFDSMNPGFMRNLTFGVLPVFKDWRFTPLSHVDGNIIFGITGNYFMIGWYCVLKQILVLYLMYKCFDFIEKSKRLYLVALINFIPAVFSINNIVFPEQNIAIFVFLSLIGLNKYQKTHKGSYLLLFFLFMNFAIYTKETIMLFYGGYGLYLCAEIIMKDRLKAGRVGSVVCFISLLFSFELYLLLCWYGEIPWLWDPGYLKITWPFNPLLFKEVLLISSILCVGCCIYLFYFWKESVKFIKAVPVEFLMFISALLWFVFYYAATPLLSNNRYLMTHYFEMPVLLKIYALELAIFVIALWLFAIKVYKNKFSDMCLMMEGSLLASLLLVVYVVFVIKIAPSQDYPESYYLYLPAVFCTFYIFDNIKQKTLQYMLAALIFVISLYENYDFFINMQGAARHELVEFIASKAPLKQGIDYNNYPQGSSYMQLDAFLLERQNKPMTIHFFSRQKIDTVFWKTTGWKVSLHQLLPDRNIVLKMDEFYKQFLIGGYAGLEFSYEAAVPGDYIIINKIYDGNLPRLRTLVFENDVYAVYVVD